jgi:DNA-binding IclR family transcriptional regulator
MVDDSANNWGVRELARGVGLPPSTVHRVLEDLQQQGFVRSDVASSRYSLGTEFFRLAWKSATRFPLRDAAMPALKRLAASTDETAYLGVYDPVRRQMFFAATVESSNQLRYVIVLNTWMPIHLGASGLAILAFLPESERRVVLADVDSANQRPKQSLALQAAIDEVRRKGYARTYGQRLPGAVGIAAPIFVAHETVLGDVGVTIPSFRYQDRDEPRLSKAVMAAAAEVATELGNIARKEPELLMDRLSKSKQRRARDSQPRMMARAGPDLKTRGRTGAKGQPSRAGSREPRG